ncbi:MULTISPECIES: hypothetical protein [unclassified Halorubrum]|uniref:hypothetical protein n=1 Tax=unclassified Halorubrum TaxID=2642239 RepID=UPI001305285A|nr:MULTISPECIES: hypothetical protein [unclassified Halorubrum]
MVRQAAQVIGLLMTILTLVSWLVINSNLPGTVGAGVNLVAVIVSMLTGLFAYVAVIKS